METAPHDIEIPSAAAAGSRSAENFAAAAELVQEGKEGIATPADETGSSDSSGIDLGSSDAEHAPL